MNCPKCNAELENYAVVCNACGEHFAVELQRGKFLAARAITKDILENICRSRIFLVLSIFMSILCGASAIIVLRSIIGGSLNIGSALIFAFSLVAIIAAWSLYSGKTKLDAAKIKRMKMLNTLLRVFANIIYICMIVVFVCILICIPFMNKATDIIAQNSDVAEMLDEAFYELYDAGIISIEDYNMLISDGLEYVINTFFIVGAIICAALAVLYAFFANAYKKADIYLKELANTVQTSEYRTNRVPDQFLFVMGIIHSVLAIFSLSVDFFSGVETGCIGACMIITALIFKRIHKEQTQNNATIASEEAELIRVSSLTNDYVQREAQWAAQRARMAALENQGSGNIDTPNSPATDAPLPDETKI